MYVVGFVAELEHRIKCKKVMLYYLSLTPKFLTLDLLEKKKIYKVIHISFSFWYKIYTLLLSTFTSNFKIKNK